MKRNTENKYRIKIMQEWHLGKQEQRYVDNYIREHKMSCKEFYGTYIKLDYVEFKLNAAIENMAKVLASLSKQCSDVVSIFSRCFNELKMLR